jgi:Arc/MetJ-type ribon-helix-helix transcriptional regulator
MIPEFQEEICFRLSREEKKQISEIVKEGKFANQSEVIRTALKILLKTTK